MGTQTTETVDSLYENVKFPEEKNEGGKRLKKPKKAKKESKSEEVESSSKDKVSDEGDSSQCVEDGKILTENSSKRKETELEDGAKKKVKTASGTFNVSKK